MTTLRVVALSLALPVLLAVLASKAQAQAASGDGPPVKVTKCSWTFDDPKSHDYSITVGSTFSNVSEKTAVAVKFTFTSLDDFGKRLQSTTKTVYGTFATGAQIEPRRRIGDRTMFTDAASAAVEFYNAYSTEVTTMECRADAVKFSDGSIWTNPRTRD